jgi:hypothetical protein
LPRTAWLGEGFEIDDIGAQPTAAVRLRDPDYWAARLDDADKMVAQRTWTTEIGLLAHDHTLLKFGCRLLCVTRGPDETYRPTIPGLVRQIIANGSAWLDGRVMSEDPWFVETEADVDDLVALLVDKKRTRDVHVLALPEGSTDPSETVISAKQLHLATLGASHVVILSDPASFHLTERLGKQLSVFRQAVRTYRPSFDADLDGPYAHPLVLPDWVDSWPSRHMTSFEGFLIDQTIRRTVTGSDLERDLPPFTQIKEISAARHYETALEGGATDRELLHLMQSELELVRASFDEEKATYDGLLMAQNEEIETVRQRERDLMGQIGSLKARQDYLESLQQAPAAAPMSHAVEIPVGLADLREWSDKHLAGTVILLNRAFAGAKKSMLEDTSLVFEALLLLRDFYVPMRRMGGLDRKEAYETQCGTLGIEEATTLGEGQYGRFQDEYIVHYKGERRKLDRHLKKGRDHDERTCFRLYFFWDDDDQQVVVGWLPSHLTTRQT